MSVLCARNIASCHSIIVTTKLIISFLVEVVTMWVKEIATREHVEVVIVILSWSVLNLLSSELSDSWNLLDLLVDRIAILRKCLEIWVRDLLHIHISWTILLEPIGLLWRWWFSLIFELAIVKV